MKIAGLFVVYRDDAGHHRVRRDWDVEIIDRDGRYITRESALQDIERQRVPASRRMSSRCDP